MSTYVSSQKQIWVGVPPCFLIGVCYLQNRWDYCLQKSYDPHHIKFKLTNTGFYIETERQRHYLILEDITLLNSTYLIKLRQYSDKMEIVTEVKVMYLNFWSRVPVLLLGCVCVLPWMRATIQLLCFAVEVVKIIRLLPEQQTTCSFILLFYRFPSNNQCSTYGKL